MPLIKVLVHNWESSEIVSTAAAIIMGELVCRSRRSPDLTTFELCVAHPKACNGSDLCSADGP